MRKLPTSFLPEIGVFVRTSLVQRDRCDQLAFWTCVNGALIPYLAEEIKKSRVVAENMEQSRKWSVIKFWN